MRPPLRPRPAGRRLRRVRREGAQGTLGVGRRSLGLELPQLDGKVGLFL